MCEQITKTRFINIPIAYTPERGIPIGQGECKAVRLRINAFQRNSIVAVSADPVIVYFGDSQSQENELIAFYANAANKAFLQNDWSPEIKCTDLSQVFIRNGINGSVINVKIMIME